jgi:hypothetical protein
VIIAWPLSCSALNHRERPLKEQVAHFPLRFASSSLVSAHSSSLASTFPGNSQLENGESSEESVRPFKENPVFSQGTTKILPVAIWRIPKEKFPMFFFIKNVRLIALHFNLILFIGFKKNPQSSNLM